MRLKDLERGWKRLLFQVLKWWVGRFAPPAEKDWRAGGGRVLFLRQDKLGDAIVSTGLLRAIRSLSPTLQLDVLASPRNADFFRRLPCVDEVLLFDKRSPRTFPAVWRRLRAGRYDAVIDCMVTAPSMTGFLLMLSSGATRRVGVGGRGIDWGLTHPVPLAAGHIIEAYAEFIRAFGELPDAFDWRPEIPLGNARADVPAVWASSGRRVLLNVSAGEARRDWPDERYAEVARNLAGDDGVGVVLIGSPAEWSRVQSIADIAGLGAAVPTPTLDRLFELIRDAHLLVTPDTSLIHMASAFRTPTVGLFIGGTSNQWGPFQIPGRILEGSDNSLLSISAREVVAAARDCLGEIGSLADSS